MKFKDIEKLEAAKASYSFEKLKLEKFIAISTATLYFEGYQSMTLGSNDIFIGIVKTHLVNSQFEICDKILKTLAELDIDIEEERINLANVLL